MKKANIFLIGGFIFVAVFSECKKHNASSDSDTSSITEIDTSIKGDGLSPEDANSLDSATIHIPYGHIFNPDGTLIYASSPKLVINGDHDQKVTSDNSKLVLTGANNSASGILRDQLIQKLLHDVYNLSEQKYIATPPSTFTHPDEGTDKPAHMGYAYSYGQRNYTQRLQPPQNSAANSLHKKYYVYGTDCSGLMINLFADALLPIPDCRAISFEGALRSTLSTSGTYSNIRLANLGQLPQVQFKSGDFIVWSKMGHVGIIANSSDGLAFFSSHGTPNPKTLQDQMNNWGINRGIHSLSFAKMNAIWGTNYVILRLVSMGDPMLGGILFYLDNTNKHGLIAATQDQGYNVAIPHDIPETGDISTTGNEAAIYSGWANTQKLINSNTVVKAVALFCTNYRGGSYSDWYLPSRLELAELYKQKDIVGNFSPPGYYTSSTWVVSPDPDYYSPGKGATFIAIEYINFSDGSSYGVDGNSRGGAPVYPPADVRAIRAF